MALAEDCAEFCECVVIIRGENKKIVKDNNDPVFEISEDTSDDGLQNARGWTNSFRKKLGTVEAPGRGDRKQVGAWNVVLYCTYMHPYVHCTCMYVCV